MKLGTQVGFGPGHIVLDANPALPSPKGGTAPDFRPMSIVAFSALPSVIWHCWLGGKKGIRPVKMGDCGGGHWLVRMEWRPAGWSVCLPLLIFPCTINSRRSLLAPAHPGGPGKGP